MLDTTRMNPHHVAEGSFDDLMPFYLTLSEAAGVAPNRPLWKLLAASNVDL